MKKLYGLSMSICVREIAEGKHDLERVKYIISSDRFKTLDEAIDRYKDTAYWKENKQACIDVCTELWNSDRIVQPRLIFGDHYFPHVYGMKELFVEGVDKLEEVLKPHGRCDFDLFKMLKAVEAID